MGSFVAAERLAGGEDPAAVRALEELGLAVRRVGIGGRDAFHLDPLVARAVAAESLIRPEELPARVALVPGPLPP